MSHQKNNYPFFIDLFAKAPIKKTFGMVLSYNEKGEAVFNLPYNANLNHALKDTHGGIVCTLIDNAGWFTAAAHYGKWVVTSDLNIRLLEAANNEDLISRGWIVRAGRLIFVAEMEVKSKSGRLIAIGSGSFVVTSKEMK